jgi:integrase
MKATKKSGSGSVKDGRTQAWCSQPISAPPSNAANVRKMFKRGCRAAGVGDGWTPRELRTSFVSLMRHGGVSIEEIARLVGHSSTRTTEVVYRRELRPVITTGAEIMDEVFRGSWPFALARKLLASPHQAASAI